MNFYQKLQLDQTGSRAYIIKQLEKNFDSLQVVAAWFCPLGKTALLFDHTASLNTPKEQVMHTGIDLFQMSLCVAFCNERVNKNTTSDARFKKRSFQ